MNEDRFCSITEVRRTVGDVSRSTLYRWIGDSEFPAPYRIGGRAAWSHREVQQWIAEKKDAADRAREGRQ